MIFVLYCKNFIGKRHRQNKENGYDLIENWIVSIGRCIIPNLRLFLEDSFLYLPSLTKLKLLDVLNKANDLISAVLLETGMRVTEKNL